MDCALSTGGRRNAHPDRQPGRGRKSYVVLLPARDSGYVTTVEGGGRGLSAEKRVRGGKINTNRSGPCRSRCFLCAGCRSTAG